MLHFLGARRRRVRTRSAVAAVLMFLALWSVPSVASAHAVLLRTTPTGDVRSAPNAVQIVFDESPRTRFSVVHVLGPDGQRRDAGALSVQNGTVTQPLTGSRPPGQYTVDWRVVSDDGHPVSGQWRFTVTAAAPALPSPAAPAAAPADAGSGGGHLGHVLLAVVVVVLLGLSWVLERLWQRRKAGP